jgi:oxygen-independent coproporphyrinogen-3 oxidase
MNLSYELLKKYNVQGPRYTSYPPAPSWKDDIGPAEYNDVLHQSNDSGRPLSLYFHLPFCEQLCYFCGCTTLITGKNRSFESPYHRALESEIEWVGSRLEPSRKVIQLHLGGGTPTYGTPQTLENLMERVHKRFNFAPDAEIGVEVDPRVTTADHLKSLRKYGFNRVSMGVQDFDLTVQQAVNRVQSFQSTFDLVQTARSLGYQSVNIDLIYGLPYQTPESFQKSIEQVLLIRPDRLAVYSYAHVPWLKQHQDHFAAHLPNERQKFEILLMAFRFFMDAGFDYVGMDHFAKPNDELSRARQNRTLWRNFQGYTTKAGTDLIGFGMSAIGSVNGVFVQNEKDIKKYQTALTQGNAATHRGFRLSKDDKIRSRVIQNLLCHAKVVKAEIEKEFSISFDDYFKDSLSALKSCETDGLVELAPAEISPTDIGRVFLRNLAMPFDVYLPKPGEKKIFSRTI